MKRSLLILSCLLCTAISNLHSADQTSKDELSNIYDQYRNNKSAINQHLTFLRELSSECSSVAEIGSRYIGSTWGIIMGLSENPSPKRSFLQVEFISPPLEKLYLAKRLANENDISYRYMQNGDMELELEEPIDMLFLDGLHTYCHLTYQLEKFSPKVLKYIAVHNTSPPWGYADDTTYQGDYSEYPESYDRTKKGLSPAIDDFLSKNPGWVLYERRFNSHGFTVLKRKDKAKLIAAPDIHVFIHVCTLAQWNDVLQRQLGSIKDAGLYDACSSISLGVLGTGDMSAFKASYPKINILFQDPNVALFERPTLLSLHEKCISNPDNAIVLYLHTKGITKTSPYVTDWSKYMEYFAIDRWRDCVQALQEHDVCGVNWQLGPQPHFSGNFWWAASTYVSTLPHYIGTEYLDPEMWLCQNRPTFKCFHYSNIDHYYTPYPKSIYGSFPSSS